MYIIGLVRNQKGTGAEMRPAIVSGIVTGDAPVSYWQFLANFSPKVFAKVKSAHSPSRF